MPTAKRKKASPRPKARASHPRKRPPQRAAPLLKADDVRQILRDLATQIAPADVVDLLAHEQPLRARADALPLPLLRAQLQLALDCLRDHCDAACPQIPYYTIAMLAAAAYYFADDLDVIPDFLPRIGRLDDAVVMAMAFHLAEAGITRYCTWKGRPLPTA